MKFTWSWLKDHLETSNSLSDILNALPMLGLEVEKVDDKGQQLAPFTIARILKAEKHPNADSLQVCLVDTGAGEVSLVCGAPNAQAGLVGVFAPVGAYVPGIDLTLTTAEIRGVASNGMMCSEREMMLSDEHDGIIALDDDAPLGASFAEWSGLDDVMIEIAITPNRGDCLGVRGIARDLAAAGYGTLKPLKEMKVKPENESLIKWVVADDARDACPLVVGRSFQGVTNASSPRWMQQRLSAVGQRPISALVDITNYVMFDLGRPLHAYDADKIRGNTLTIRHAQAGEKLTALNDVTYDLDPERLIIADAEGPDDIAGVMGGARTGVTEQTDMMFLEMAVFDPISIATTGQKLNLNSDARYRFERGLDVTSPEWAMDYVSKLILDICGGKASEVVKAGMGVNWQRNISYNPQRCLELAGVDVEEEKQKEILSALGFAFDITAQSWSVTPPPWRGDIVGAADLVEEIVRIIGFDAIPEVSLPKMSTARMAAVDKKQKRPYIIKRVLAGRGMLEAVSFSFLSHEVAQRFGGGEAALRLVNPISTDLDTMRPSLIPNLLAALMRNGARGEHDGALFEVGPVFQNDTPEGQQSVVAGVRHGMTAPRDWTKAARKVDWADARGDALAVLSALGVKTDGIQTSSDSMPSWYHPGQSGALCQGRKILAYFGALHPALLNSYDLSRNAAGFEIVLDDIMLPKNKGAGRPLLQPSRYQAVGRDFAFFVGDDIKAEQLIRSIKGAGKPLVGDASLFDIYQGRGVPEGQKSVAVSVILQPTKATLTEAEIDIVSDKIIEAVEKHCGGVLRS